MKGWQESPAKIKMIINVAIDGPAGAGKSTISRQAASRLGYIYIDTGALYRTVGVYAMRSGVNLKDSQAISEMLKKEPVVELKFEDGEQRMYLNGENVSSEIRLPEASMAASAVSAVPAVREYLFELQRSIARSNNCIMDGRDIGTVVLPDAQVKIYLTASASARAKRRFLELEQKGIAASYDEVLADMVQRDYNDMNREIAPLKQADDAVLLDTSDIGLEESIELVITTIKSKIG